MTNKVVIEKWVEALESGDYPQTDGRLQRRSAVPGFERSKPGFCCLGVLCDLAVKEGVIRAEEQTDEDGYEIVAFGTDDDMDESELPIAVMEWAGLDNCGPNIAKSRFPDLPDSCYGRNKYSLIELNDTYEWDFKQLAAAIRAEYLTEEN